MTPELTETPVAQEAQETHAGTEVAAKPDVLGTLGINGPLFAAQLINVAIILVVLRTWVFKPLAKLLEERRQKIEAGLAHASEAEKRLISAKEQEDVLLAEARADARRVADEAKQHADKIRTEQLAVAKRELDAQAEEAKTKIQNERDSAMESVRKEIADLVLTATRKVSASTLDEKAHRAAIDQAIKELETSTV